MKRKMTFLLLILIAAALIGFQEASAFPIFLDTVHIKYPDIAGKRIDNCNLCHVGPDPAVNQADRPRNPYGLAFQNNGENVSALTAIEPSDPDNDGFTNIAEINTRTFPGNSNDFPLSITGFAPLSPVTDTAPATRTFNITVNQVVDNVTWFLNGVVQKTDHSVNASNFTNTMSSSGVHNVTAIAERSGDGTAIQIWGWIVTAGPLVTVTISPSAPTIVSGTNLAFTAAGADTAGNAVGITPVWSSSNQSVGTINATTGMFTALAAGITVVNATAMNITGSTIVAVTLTVAVNGTINGTVRNASSGIVISGATVAANGMTSTTDVSGKYEISIAPGTYNVTASASGFVSKTTLNVVVTPGNRTDVDFNLEPVVVTSQDTTPPEAIISFNTTTTNIQVAGIDDVDPNVNVTSKILQMKGQRSTVLFTLTDSGGNMLNMTLQIKREDDEIRTEVLGLIYTNMTNAVKIMPPENKFRNQFNLNKAGSIRELTQRSEVEEQFEVKTQFSRAKNNTKIEIEEKNRLEVKVTLPGLVTISLRTKKGDLAFKISPPVSIIEPINSKDKKDGKDKSKGKNKGKNRGKN